MDDPMKIKITRNLTFVKQSICDDLDTFVDGLIEKDVFDIDIKDRLSSARTAMEKSDILIYAILRKGSNACYEFIDLLRKKRYVHVLRKMDDIEIEEKEEKPLLFKSFLHFCQEEEGACGAELSVTNDQAKASTSSLKPTEKPPCEPQQNNYKQLQTAYKGLRDQLVEKKNQLFKMNQEKVTMEKELREVKAKNQSLHAENANLRAEAVKQKAEIEELGRHLEQKENEISEIRIQINNMEEMWKEERKSRERLEQEVHDQGKMLTVISQVVQNIAVKFDCNHDPTKPNTVHDPERTNGTQDPLNDDIIEKRQPFMQGTKTSSNNSHNSHVNKTKRQGKK
ncbi:hypothetical protein CHS0354_027273 [Potamilus streckersoni]|uniref:CARD domain-containing protein n=1 Tax=Potamilus streckersoni TaxID=2493646 RepID=A0AAE0W8Q2_9BIVA|nr:hypothetical protein CHS0354_027273 [Potamilus streckersoni]